MMKTADGREQKISSDSVTAKRPSLKLVTSDLESSSDRMGASVAEEGDSSALRQELMLALEISEAQRRENDSLKDRMSDLQKQLDSLKRLITLKDGDLAQMQQQLVQPSEVSPQKMVKEPAEEALVVPGLPDTEQTIAEAILTEAEVAKQDAAKQQEVAKQKVEPKEVSQPKPAPAPKPTQVPQPTAQPDIITMILSEPMYLGVGGGVLVLLLLLALVIIKRRKNRSHESILSGDASSMGSSTVGGPDTSFLSDLAISGLAGGGMEADEGEVDPITEADVYMAYGRHQQAESLLKDALKSDPDRLEIKSKLLEVYFSAKDKDQFDSMVAASSEQLQQNEEFWKKILVMGHELSPENPLFAEAPAVDESESTDEFDLPLTETEEAIFDDVLDIGIDLDELSAEMESSPEGDIDIDLGLDFSDLDDDIFSTSTDSDDGISEPSADTEQSFDLGELDGLGELDLDVDLDVSNEEETSESIPDVEESAIEELSDEKADEEGGIDFDISDLDLGEPSDSEEESATEHNGKTTESVESIPSSDEIDFSLDGLDDLDGSDASDLSAELDDALSSLDNDLDDIGDLSDLSVDDTELDGLDELDDLDFNLESMSEESEATDSNDLEDMVIESMKSESPEDSDDEDSGLELDGLGDLDFDFDAIVSDSVDESSDQSTTDIAEDDISDDFTLDLVEEAGDDSPDKSGVTALDDELADLADFDLGSDDSDSLDDDLDFDFDDSELDATEGDMDTKIDLAKAYIEMGDADGARSMLDEVVTQGDDGQKQQAQALLDSI
ncbi:MAG: tetratricopeptide repeat protein [Gammaproteobacteria bacterium]|nr:tetratricopeptide repeat protein [Gammaproteobacteria bacterium]